MTDPRTRAVRFAWLLLLTATALSVAGNVSTALAAVHSAEAVAVAVTVPLMLAATIHLLALMVRAGVRGWAYRGVLALVIGIATAAFLLSFEALAALATRTGHGALAPLLPVMVDAAIVACTASLVVLDREAETASDTVTVTSLNSVDAVEVFGHVAESIVASGRVQAAPDTVAEALAGLAAGRSQRSVAAATGLHRSVVGKVQKLAA